MKKFNFLSIVLLGTLIVFANRLVSQVSKSTPGFKAFTDLSVANSTKTEIHDVIDSSPKVKIGDKPVDINSGDFLVNELNTPELAQSYPWLSDNALRVYYTHGTFMYMASRNDVNAKFGKGVPVFPGMKETVISGWLSRDERTIYISSQSSKLYKAMRNSINENFATYTEVKLTGAPGGSLFDASFTPDMEELMMYNNDGRERIVKFNKTSDNEYKFSGEVNVLSAETPTGGQLSRDGLRYYVPFKRNVNGNDDYRYIYVLTRKSMHDNFNGIEQVRSLNVLNRTAYQPAVNADESRMMFVTGAENIWDNNELCEVALINEIVTKVAPKPAEPIFFNPAKVKPNQTITVKYLGDKENGKTPVIYISPDNKTVIFDYTGDTNVPEGFVLATNNKSIIVKKPSDVRAKMEMTIAPNPFNEKTRIELIAPEAGYLLVQAYSMDGQLVATLYDGECQKGVNIINWIKRGIANGIYTVKATIGNTIIVKKVVACGTN